MIHQSLLIAATWLAVGQAVEPAPRKEPPPAAIASTAVDAFKAEAAEYNLRLDSRPRDKFVLQKEPVLRWSNPARTGEDGALFVWTLNGRPEMIGTIFTYRINDKISRKHEFHSLALGPLTAEFRGKEVWTPRAAGVKFESLPESPAPAATSRQRLTQMKALARDFAATMRDNQGEQYQLRLLTQPLVRYEQMKSGADPSQAQNSDVLDGAIFAFSLGTDPEVLLLLEARATKEGHAWQYALARFHYIDLTVSHHDRKVWHAEPLPNINNLNVGTAEYRDSPYTTYHVERNIPAE